MGFESPPPTHRRIYKKSKKLLASGIASFDYLHPASTDMEKRVTTLLLWGTKERQPSQHQFGTNIRRRNTNKRGRSLTTGSKLRGTTPISTRRTNYCTTTCTHLMCQLNGLWIIRHWSNRSFLPIHQCTGFFSLLLLLTH